MALSPIGRLSFPSLYEAEAMEEGKPKKFAATQLYDIANFDTDQHKKLAAMLSAANEAALEKFKTPLYDGDNYKEVLKNVREGNVNKFKGKALTAPFRLSEEKEEYLPPDHIFVKFSRMEKKGPPGIVGPDKKTIEQQSGDIYAGCDCHISWTVLAYDKGGNKGVSFWMTNIQKTGDNEAFGTPEADAEDEFDEIDVPETEDAEDFDEIPF